MAEPGFSCKYLMVLKRVYFQCLKDDSFSEETIHPVSPLNGIAYFGNICSFDAAHNLKIKTQYKYKQR